MDGPSRLALLLPWLNGETDSDPIRQSVAKFLKSFDGSEDAGYVKAALDPYEHVEEPERRRLPAPPKNAPLTEKQLTELGTRLRASIELGFAETPKASYFIPMVATPSLRFAVRGTG